ncbi:MAG: AMP-binding protein [bacterium]
MGQLLEKRASEYEDKTYLVFNDQETSYREFDRQVNRVANALTRLGVTKGTHVNVHLGNCPEFLQTFFALTKIGAVLNPSNLALTGNELKYILDHAEAEISITSTWFKDLIKSLRPSCKNLQRIVVIGEEESEGGVISWDEMMRDTSATFRADVSSTPDDMAVLMYTTGTTALPKGVMLSHQNITSAGYSWMWAAGFTPKDRTLAGFPLFHANALVFSCVGSMAHGGSVLLLERMTFANLMELARRYNVTHFNFAGPAMALMMWLPEDPKDPVNPVRVVHCAMGSPELVEAWARRFQIQVVMAYNLTECTLATGTPISGPNRVKPGSIGWAAPSAPYPTEIRVVDPMGNDTPVGVAGEIIVRGPAVMKGYYKEPSRTAEAIKDGWLHTGDLGWRDEDDCLWFSDRLKDVVKVRGENVSSVEVEEAIGAHPKVAEVAVLGVGEAASGAQEIVASMVLTHGENAETVPPQEIIEWCKQRLAKFKIPRFYNYRDEPLPRVGGIKISKKDMRQDKKILTKGCYDSRKEEWLG